MFPEFPKSCNLQFELFNTELKVTPYGICLALALIAALLVYNFYLDYKKVDEKVKDFGYITAIVAIVGGFGGAALFQAVYAWIESGFKIFEFNGITAMGGFISGAGIFLAVYFGAGHFVFANGKEKDLHIKQFNSIFLVAPICVTIAHAIGRIGCLMAGCCHGAKVLEGQGGIYMGDGYYIPVQLYESLFLFALFALLTVMYFKRYNITHAVYLIAYAIWRFIAEFLRADTGRGSVGLGSITPSQFQSIVFLLGGIALLVVYKVKNIPFRLLEREE